MFLMTARGGQEKEEDEKKEDSEGQIEQKRHSYALACKNLKT